jgi:hypothetical protein
MLIQVQLSAKKAVRKVSNLILFTVAIPVIIAHNIANHVSGKIIAQAVINNTIS